MGIYKIKIGVLGIDLSSDTVTSETLLQGITAHDANGDIIEGSYEPQPPVQTEQGYATVDGYYSPTAGKFFDSFTVDTGTLFGNCGYRQATTPVHGQDNVKWAFNNRTKTLAFWATEENAKFGIYNNSYQGNIKEPWRDFAEEINFIVFDSSITTLQNGENLFGHCTNLKECFCSRRISSIGNNFGGICPDFDLYVFAIPNRLNSNSICNSLNVFKTFTETGNALKANTIRFPSWDMAAQSNYRQHKPSSVLQLLDGSEPPENLILGANSIADSAFRDCSTIETVFGINVTTIDSNSFLNCENLTEVNFPNVTRLGGTAWGGGSCFKNTGIRHYTAPKSLVKFGRAVFEGNAQAASNDFILDFTQWDETKIDTSGEIEVLDMTFDYGFGVNAQLRGEIWFSDARVLAAAQNTTNLTRYSSQMILKTGV